MEQVHTSSERVDRAEFEPSLHGAAREARRGVQNLSEAGLRWVDDFLETRRNAAVEELGGIASALHSAARSLDEQQRGRAAQFAAAAAERIEQFCEQLRQREPRQLLAPLQELARRQPALLLGGALAAGLLLARLLGSSGTEPSQPLSSPTSERTDGSERLGGLAADPHENDDPSTRSGAH